MILARRRFLSLLPAPLIVSAANIMPVKALLPEEPAFFGTLLGRPVYAEAGGYFTPPEFAKTIMVTVYGGGGGGGYTTKESNYDPAAADSLSRPLL